MRKKMIGLVALVACWALVPGGYAQKGGKGGGVIPLVAVFRDAGANFTVTNPDRIMSDCRLGDTAASGCPYVNGQNSVSLSFSGNGNFTLQVEKDTRNIYLNFTDCVISPCPPNEPSFLPSGQVEALVGTERGRRAKLFVIGLGGLGVGDSKALNADLLFERLVDLRDGEEEVWWVTYRSNPPAVCPEGSSKPVVASHPDPNTWVVEPGTTDIACLHSLAPKPNGDGSEEFHGAYVMPFRLTITTQP